MRRVLYSEEIIEKMYFSGEKRSMLVALPARLLHAYLRLYPDSHFANLLWCSVVQGYSQLALASRSGFQELHMAPEAARPTKGKGFSRVFTCTAKGPIYSIGCSFQVALCRAHPCGRSRGLGEKMQSALLVSEVRKNSSERA